MFKGFLLGILIGILLIAGGVYYYFSGGFAPVATRTGPRTSSASLPSALSSPSAEASCQTGVKQVPTGFRDGRR